MKRLSPGKLAKTVRTRREENSLPGIKRVMVALKARISFHSSTNLKPALSSTRDGAFFVG